MMGTVSRHFVPCPLHNLPLRTRKLPVHYPRVPHEEVEGRQTKFHPGFTLGKVVQPVFPNKPKISLDSRSCKLETITRPSKIYQTVGGQYFTTSYWKKYIWFFFLIGNIRQVCYAICNICICTDYILQIAIIQNNQK